MSVYSRTAKEKLLAVFYNLVFTLRHGKGSNFMEESWDNLIILDACRYDDFREENFIEGRLESRVSMATDSPEFIRSNFNSGKFQDTVYVTANPHVEKLDSGVFHEVVTEPLENFDYSLGTVPPDEVTRSVLKTHRRFPGKKIVAHYMQPHDPPIGETGDRLRQQADLGGWRPDTGEDRSKRLMPRLARGEIDTDTAREAYRENIRIALEEVEELLEKLEGRTVITADHGEMFGEKYPLIGRMYEHWKKPRTVELCRVPWLVVDGERRETVAEEPSGELELDRGEIKEKLELLGYGS